MIEISRRINHDGWLIIPPYGSLLRVEWYLDKKYCYEEAYPIKSVTMDGFIDRANAYINSVVNHE